MRKRKISAILLSALVASTTILGSVSVQAKTMIEGPITYGAEPIIPGTEDIIAQDTVWKYNVTQTTNYGVMVTVTDGLLALSGVGKVTTMTARSLLAGSLATYLVNNISPTSYIVNMKLDRYIVRGADGREYYKIFATYYQTSGAFIGSKLVQEGKY